MTLAQPEEDLRWMADASAGDLREWALRVLEEPVEPDPVYGDGLPRLPQPRRHEANELLGLLGGIDDKGSGDV